MRVALVEVAHSRAGDKGTLTTVSLIAYSPQWYPALVEQVTTERVAAHLRDRIVEPVTRYEVPRLSALNFVCARPPGDSVTTSFNLDTHGKSVSDALLSMSVDIDATVEEIRHVLGR